MPSKSNDLGLSDLGLTLTTLMTLSHGKVRNSPGVFPREFPRFFPGNLAWVQIPALAGNIFAGFFSVRQLADQSRRTDNLSINFIGQHRII